MNNFWKKLLLIFISFFWKNMAVSELKVMKTSVIHTKDDSV